jgi:D-alanyl-D-alanine dipeptidase
VGLFGDRSFLSKKGCFGIKRVLILLGDFMKLLIAALLFACSLHAHRLVNVQSKIPSIVVDLRYATDNNFTQKIVYNFDQCLVLDVVAERLLAVQEELSQEGYGLKIWDGFRPFSAQWAFWDIVQDERYVSDPRKGGRHTRGTAVDVTLVFLDTKEEVAMPTLFDDFSEKAHRNYYDAQLEKEIANRNYLQKVMERNGFKGISTEWWHFDLEGWENYPPITQDISELLK